MQYQLLKAINRGDVFNVATHLCDDDQKVYDDDDVSMLQRASWSGNVDVCRLVMDSSRCKHMLNAKDRDGETPLMAACRLGYPTVVELFLERGATFDSLDIFAGPLIHVLHRLCTGCCAACHKSVDEEEMCKVLVRARLRSVGQKLHTVCGGCMEDLFERLDGV